MRLPYDPLYADADFERFEAEVKMRTERIRESQAVMLGFVRDKSHTFHEFIEADRQADEDLTWLEQITNWLAAGDRS